MNCVFQTQCIVDTRMSVFSNFEDFCFINFVKNMLQPIYDLRTNIPATGFIFSWNERAAPFWEKGFQNEKEDIRHAFWKG